MAQQTTAPQGQNDSFELKEGQINIFTNQKRENETQPHYWGKLKIMGWVWLIYTTPATALLQIGRTNLKSAILHMSIPNIHF